MAVVSGKPQYNYQKPSGGAISPGGTGRPYSGSSSGGSTYPAQSASGVYDYNKQSSGNGKFSGAPSFSSGIGGNFGFPEGTVGSQGQIVPNVNYDQPAIIQKNVYVHIPPPELEEGPDAPAPLPVGAPEKNYKIIFIKAPAPKQSQAPIIPPQPPKEEKTLVYVLVKKPEEAVQPIISTPEPTQPSKPEVFFIRYKPVREDGVEGEGQASTGPGFQAGGPTKDIGSQTVQGFPSQQTGNQAGGLTKEIGGQTVQGYPSQQTGNQGAGYLPPDNRKPANGGY